MNSLMQKEFQTIQSISGPILVAEGLQEASFGEIVHIKLADGTKRLGQVLEVTEKFAVIQVLESTQGLDIATTKIRLTGEVAKLAVSSEMIGRTFNGRGELIDNGPELTIQKRLEVMGSPLNPVMRDQPADFIQTGISAIDGLNTLVRGQKLPIFSGSGLPANELVAKIIRQAKVKSGEDFVIVFGAMGLSFREAEMFRKDFEESGAFEKVVFFLNMADDPSVERILTPRCALTAAEYLAFDLDKQVLVILSDMTNYCETLREVAAAREEVPGRRGYPGYMYTDLASLYERAGRVKGKLGSITQLDILTMPDDDITHPIVDLTGYITEGQIVLSRELFRNGINPPINVLPSLSRLMNLGIGEGKTRADHRGVADQLYAFYARGVELKKLSSIIGEEGLSETDKLYLDFANKFEHEYLNQMDENRDIEDTLAVGWKLLSMLPKTELKRVKPALIEQYYGK